MKEKQIIVSLDGLNRHEALSLAWSLSSHVWGVEVNDLVLNCGINIVRDLKCICKVFVNVKLYDTPENVVSNVNKISEVGADFIAVHASGGKEMMQAAVETCGQSKILAIPALPYLTDSDIQPIYSKNTDEMTWDLAHLAKESGVHGIICSASQIEMLNHLNMLKVCYGIHANKADLFVVGKEITNSLDPCKSLKKLIKEIK